MTFEKSLKQPGTTQTYFHNYRVQHSVLIVHKHQGVIPFGAARAACLGEWQLCCQRDMHA